MKSAICAVWVATALQSGISSAWAFDGEPSGFRGIDWGTPYDSVKSQMTAHATEGGDDLYDRIGDKMSLGEAQLKGIRYFFYKGQFAGAFVVSKPGEEAAMIRAFVAQFGDGEKPNQFMESRLWRGATTTMSLDCNEIESSCEALILSSALQEKEKQDQDTAAAGAKSDF